MQDYKRNFIISVLILILFFLVLVGRIWYLQIVKGDEFEEFSKNNRIRNLRVPAPRGRILDRNGKGIVINRSSFDLYVVPSEVENEAKFIKFISTLLQMDEDVLNNSLNSTYKYGSFDQVLLARDITRDQLALIESRRNMFPWLFVEVNQVRKYPLGNTGANFIGYLGKPTKQDLESNKGLSGFDLIGRSGLEKKLQTFLKGKDGYKQKVTDALGREIKSTLFKSDTVYKDSISGSDVILTIDKELQAISEQIMGSMSGAIVVLDVNSGEVLSLVSKPSYDPSLFAKGIETDVWLKLISDASYPFLNRATRGIYPPGSVYKIVTAASAVGESVVDPDTKVFCPGHYRIGKRVFHCWKRGGHGWVDFNKALVESCDVYFYHIAEKLGIEKIYKYSKLFGFGSLTGIEIAESAGLSPNKKWKRDTYKQSWYKGDTINASIGQGYVSVTPLQIAVMTSIVANGGYMIYPHLVKEVLSNSGEKIYSFKKQPKKLDIDENVLKLIKEAMIGAINDPTGTARAARVQGLVVAGKTGTAQVRALSAIKDNKKKHNHHAWFTSFVPADNPEIAVTVLVEHGGGGGAVAAPISKKVITSYYNIKNRQSS